MKPTIAFKCEEISRLCLTLRIGESIQIGSDIMITVKDSMSGHRSKLLVTTSRSKPITRPDPEDIKHVVDVQK